MEELSTPNSSLLDGTGVSDRRLDAFVYYCHGVDFMVLLIYLIIFRIQLSLSFFFNRLFV